MTVSTPRHDQPSKQAPKTLRRRHFGDPVLRQVARRLSEQEIVSSEIQTLIADIRHTVTHKRYGVGLAAPQVGHSLNLCIVAIKPTPSRPKNPHIEMVVINPEIVRTYGRRSGMWEGCISFGLEPDLPYAQAMRYKKIRVRYMDEHAVSHERDFDGPAAHVLQHEIDHLNGVLFVDRVKDTTTYMTIGEYKKRHLAPSKQRQAS